MKIVVLVSGGGTNLQAILDAISSGRLTRVEVVGVISSKKTAFALDRALRAEIPVKVIRPKDYATEEEFDTSLLRAVRSFSPDYLVLAGYLSKIGPQVLQAFPDKILNIHPALLPQYGGEGMYGLHVHEAVLANHEEWTGATVHLLNEEYDKGKILAQKRVKVCHGDTPESLQQRVMVEAEWKIYPEVLQKLAHDGLDRILPAGKQEEMQKEEIQMKKALLSVFNKEGLLPFAQSLVELGYGLISTGGTAHTLREAGLEVEEVSDLTGFPECLGGRVKTLHPKVHAGILARRSEPGDMEFLNAQKISPIDLVIVNLYPFKETIQKPDCTWELAIENIDIGGPTMLRAAAKNHEAVTVVCDPHDYDQVIDELKGGEISLFTRKRLAAKVFQHTAAYDALVADYLTTQVQQDISEKKEAAFASGNEASYEELLKLSSAQKDSLTLTYQKVQDLRYGENPHQNAVFYRTAIPETDALTEAQQLQGKELSYNNIADTDAALQTLKEFTEPTIVAVKHANPCGIGSAKTIEEAWSLAYEADPVSIFGGIVASNREVSGEMAENMKAIFLEVVVAPSYSPEALTILQKKKNLRLLVLPECAKPYAQGDQSYKFIHGGLLVQDTDRTDFNMEDVHVVTEKGLEEGDFAKIRFAMRCVKHVKSNAVALTQGYQTVGIGPGQPNRITSVEIACKQAGEKTQGAILASDAFFPFDDCVRYAADKGVRLIVQPGGSIHDDESVKAANELGICMVFTGQRHFKH